MPDYLIRKPLQPGLNIIRQADAGRGELLSFSILRLQAGRGWSTHTGAEECGVIVLSGIARLAVDGQQYPDFGGRVNVFSENATALYAPPGSDIELVADSDFECALVCCPSRSEGPHQVIRPSDVTVSSVGAWNWRRDVAAVIMDNVPQAQRLLVGETFNPPGNWSSYPPHKHERDDPPFEAQMEELYHFRINPPQGWSVQRMYTDDRSLDETYCIHNEDSVLLPCGYHPVCAAAGYQLYYLWMMAGHTTRKMRPRDDPDHAWVKVAGVMASEIGF